MRRELALMTVATLAGCLSAPDGRQDEAPAEPDNPCADEGPHGERLSYALDDVPQLGVVRDRSGRGFDASIEGGELVAGQLGDAILFDSDTKVFVPDQPQLDLGDHLTIEAWVRRDGSSEPMAIVSDLDLDEGGDSGNCEVHLGIDEDGHLVFMSNHDRDIIEARSQVLVPRDEFVHVAVTWDGGWVRFYIGAVLQDAVSLNASVINKSDSWRVGRVKNDNAGNQSFEGVIDEVRVSACPKTAEQLEQSMNATEVERCGDGVIDGDEDCDVLNMCCERDACTYSVIGDVCADESGMCDGQGACVVSVAERPTDYIAEYDFDELEGLVAFDASGNGHDLQLNDATWDGLGLHIDNTIGSADIQPAILGTCLDSVEFTIEAWLASNELSGERFIAGIIPDPRDDNDTPGVALGQVAARYFGAVVSGRSDSNGGPVVISGNDADGSYHHVVVVRDGGGHRRIYVDGQIRSGNIVRGNFEDWSDTVTIQVGGRADGTAAWKGVLYRLGLLCRAMTHEQILRSRLAGPD